jgi:transposase
VILLSHEKKKAPEIAAIVGYSTHSVTNWINRSNEEGFDGLGDRPHGGSEPTWDELSIW